MTEPVADEKLEEILKKLLASLEKKGALKGLDIDRDAIIETAKNELKKNPVSEAELTDPKLGLSIMFKILLPAAITNHLDPKSAKSPLDQQISNLTPNQKKEFDEQKKDREEETFLSTRVGKDLGKENKDGFIQYIYESGVAIGTQARAVGTKSSVNVADWAALNIDESTVQDFYDDIIRNLTPTPHPNKKY